MIRYPLAMTIDLNLQPFASFGSGSDVEDSGKLIYTDLRLSD